jgi:hypothetical protein
MNNVERSFDPTSAPKAPPRLRTIESSLRTVGQSAQWYWSKGAGWPELTWILDHPEEAREMLEAGNQDVLFWYFPKTHDMSQDPTKVSLNVHRIHWSSNQYWSDHCSPNRLSRPDDRFILIDK